MRYQVFQYALPAPPELDDLNAFLASNRIASVQHQIVQSPSGGQLVFVVQTQESGPSKARGRRSEPPVDYKERLSPETFEVYTRLRDERKRISESEGVPLYTIFHNAQLAAIAERDAKTLADLEGIDGLGKQRIERYGQRMLAAMGAAE